MEPEPLHIDENLARILSIYDQEIGDADGIAPTLLVPQLPPESADPANESSPTPVDPEQQKEVTVPATTHAHRIGRFELRRQLGKGGCGIVFLAFDPTLSREVALKIPRPEMLLSPNARERFVLEAMAAAEFDHPNLVPVYEAGEIGQVSFIATAYCPGQTLAAWLNSQALPVPVRQVAQLLAQIADALQHAHDRGVLHRDLKPNNIILQLNKEDPELHGLAPGACRLRGEYFIPRVVDFGLAKLAARGPTDVSGGLALGTPKYMAPEQAQGKQAEVGPAADIYALGVILYECLVGKAPYEGGTDIETLRQAIEGNFVHPRVIRKTIPRDLEAICLKAMATKPRDRYRTAVDLADDLRRYLAGRPTLARPLRFLGRSSRWARRNDKGIALATVSALAIFFLSLGGWTMYQGQQMKLERDASLKQQAERSRADRFRDYSAQVRGAYLSWRSGDPRQMADSLATARTFSQAAEEPPCFAWGYLSGLGKAERVSVPCPAGPADAMAVSPIGGLLATGHRDGTLAIWTPEGQALTSIKAHPGPVSRVVFILDGKAVITAGAEPVARTWILNGNKPPIAGPTLPAMNSNINSLAVSRDGKVVFAGSLSGEIARWDAVAERVTKTWQAIANGKLIVTAVSPDGKTLATAGTTGPVRLWDATNGTPAGELRRATGANALIFVVDENRGWLVAAAGRDGIIRMFDRDGREVHALMGHSQAVLTLTASQDGSTLASGGMDDSTCVWDVRTATVRSVFRGHDRAVRRVRFSPDASTLYTVADDGLLKLWDLTADPEGLTLRDLPAAVAAVAARPDGQGYAIGFADGTAEVSEVASVADPRLLPAGGRGAVSPLRYPATAPPVGVELVGGSAVCWEFGSTVKQLLRVELPGGAIANIADLSPDATRLAIGDDRGRVSVWAVPSGERLGEFENGLGGSVRLLNFSTDGKRLATPTTENRLGVWDVGDATPKYRVQGQGGGLWMARFLPGGDRLVTVGRGGSIRLWDLPAGREERTLLGHVGRVTALAIAPDGRTLATGSGSGEVRLWDLRTGQELMELRRHTGPVSAAMFSANGKLLLTGGTTPLGSGELAFWTAGKSN